MPVDLDEGVPSMGPGTVVCEEPPPKRQMALNHLTKPATRDEPRIVPHSTQARPTYPSEHDRSGGPRTMLVPHTHETYSHTSIVLQEQPTPNDRTVPQTSTAHPHAVTVEATTMADGHDIHKQRHMTLGQPTLGGNGPSVPAVARGPTWRPRSGSQPSHRVRAQQSHGDRGGHTGRVPFPSVMMPHPT